MKATPMVMSNHSTVLTRPQLMGNVTAETLFSLSFQRVDPATMADPPPSGSPQESTSPEVGNQQCYVWKNDLTIVPD